MPLLDAEEAVWLGGLFGQAVVEMSAAPGVTVEVDGDETQWVQVLPVESLTRPGTLDHFLLNFPYREHDEDPLALVNRLNFTPPPDTESAGYEAGHFARLKIRPDIPLVGLAHFVGDLLKKVVGADDDAELAVQIDYGY